MKISLCTISFRHHLLSIDDIARFARANRFDGIELWGVHARNLGRGNRAEWLDAHDLVVPMLSDYLPLESCADDFQRHLNELCTLAKNWNAPRLRTFAGTMGSAGASREDRRRIAQRLALAAAHLEDHDIRLLVETHPGTLADTTASLVDLIDEVDHSNLKVNFDTLHVWEGGDDPLSAHAALADHVDYYHLKNVRSRADLSVFAPANVYAPSGRRDGMTRLFKGLVDFESFLASLLPDAEASLEWFGENCFPILSADLVAVRTAVAARREIGKARPNGAAHASS